MSRALLLLVLTVLLLGSDLDPPGTEVIVAFSPLRFEPSTVEVRPGTRVTFHNIHAGNDTYTIVASDGSFESWPLGPHGEWSYRFKTRGEHGYFIKEHPETKGKAVVRWKGARPTRGWSCPAPARSNRPVVPFWHRNSGAPSHPLAQAGSSAPSPLGSRTGR
jgi:hypothetical protein